MELKKKISVKSTGRIFCGTCAETVDLYSENFYTLIYCKSGEMRPNAEKSHALKGGEFVLLDKGVKAEFCSDGTRAFIIEFDFKTAVKNINFNRAEKVGDYKRALLSESENVCEDLFGSLFDFTQKESRADANELSAQILKNSLELFLCDFIGVKSDEQKSFNDLFFGKKSAGALAAKTIYEYLEDHAAENLTLTKIAEDTFFSPSYIKKVFKKYADKTVFEALTEIRIKKAKQMLSDGKSVKETAESLSFCNSAYFAARFKKVTGVTPSEFRQY